jgi:gluconate 2-dehydrogenase gamma chain
MTRRELIQKTTMALGYAVSGPTVMGILNGCALKHALSYTPVFFNEEQAVIIGDLAENIIPRTNTPGAKDAGVPAFIDAFVKDVYTKEEQEKLLVELKEFNEGSRDRYHRFFIECTPDSQALYVNQVNIDALKEMRNIADGWWATTKAERSFLLKMKELTILGFFSSEIGATQVLQYNPAPGPFQGCVPLEKVGKAWAT